jgi:hypothetical protein
MPTELPGNQVSDYRLAPVLGTRLVGALLIAVAVLLLVLTVLVGAFGLPLELLLALALAGVVAVFAAGYFLTRRLVVVRLGVDGYRVRLVRGVGVAAAAWTEVEEAVTTTTYGAPVVVLKLTEARTTTIPVSVLAVDREEFVRDLRGHLQRGQGLRPL